MGTLKSMTHSPIEKHPLWLRIVHWTNGPLLFLMIWSGLLIYWANPAYPPFFPEWFYNAFDLKQRLADGMSTHFTIAWLFILNSTVYLAFVLGTGHYRELFPTRASMRLLLPTVLHDLGLSKKAPPPSKFNAAQRVAYTGTIFLGLVEIASGFAVYKPVQLRWLAAIFGGYAGARLVHFIAMILFVLFFITHVMQVARAGWNNFRAMVAGFEIETEKKS